MSKTLTLYNGIRFPVDKPDYDNIERLDLSYMPIMHHMMNAGLPIDPDHFAKMDIVLTQEMDKITEQVYDISGHYINVGSPDQVSDLLFKKLGLKQAKLRMTASGDKESSAYEVLVAIQHDHLVVPFIMKYRELDKLRGTYVRPIPKLAVRKGRYRVLLPNLGQTRVPSGRNNCSEPNLLAIPNRTKLARQVSEGFIAPDGWAFLSVDVSQLEPRWSTHLSQDKNLLKIYRNNEDIYSDFAITAFKLKDDRFQCKAYTGGCTEHEKPTWHYPSVDKKRHRFPAKTCTLASFYRVSGEGLSEQMPVVCKNCNKEATEHDCGKYEALWTEDPCQELINTFDLKYEGFAIDFRREQDRRMRRYAKTWDLWGRVLHCVGARSTHPWVMSSVFREGGNFDIQSGGRGLIKLGEAKIFAGFEMMNCLDVCYPVLDVHDEILCLCREDLVEEMGMYCVSEFENIVPLTVPVKTGMASAENWGKISK